jgi:hypothetical protein
LGVTGGILAAVKLGVAVSVSGMDEGVRTGLQATIRTKENVSRNLAIFSLDQNCVQGTEQLNYRAISVPFSLITEASKNNAPSGREKS